MSVLSKLFVSSSDRFYVLFEKAAKNLIEMSHLFESAVAGDEHVREKSITSIAELEHDNGKLAHRLLTELGGSYITPFDREDIHFLASTLDELSRDLWGVTRLLDRYNIKDEENASLKVAEHLVVFSGLLEKAIKGLRNRLALKLLTNTCDKMREVNSLSDETIDATIASIVNAGAQNPKALIQKMDYYELLQTTIGNCRKVTNVIDGIVIKYG